MQAQEIHAAIRTVKREIARWPDPVVGVVARQSGRDPFLVLISCLLSLRTKDKTTAEASERLFALANAGEIPADQVDLLVTVSKKPVATAIRQLTPDLRRRIGVRLDGDGDQPLIKSVDSTIEKAVTSVINAAIKEAQAEGA